MGITTRVATVDDAEAIATAHMRAWQVAYEGMVPAEFLASMELAPRIVNWRENLAGGNLPDGAEPPLNVVAETDGVVAAFSCLGPFREIPNDPSLREVWAIYAHPDHWGTGAGYALMVDALARFRAQNCSTAYLWVLDDNQLARRFYERQGWQADDATKLDDIAGASIVERRYSIEL